MNINLGWDVHSYTKVIQTQLPSLISNLQQYCNSVHINYMCLSEILYVTMINEMETQYGNNAGINNIKNKYKNGCISDNDLPNLNIIILLYLTWELAKYGHNKDPSNEVFKNVGIMLNEINKTCMQGISHRLYLEFEYLYDIYYVEYISFISTLT